MTQNIARTLAIIGVATLAGCSSNKHRGTTVAYDSGYITHNQGYVATSYDSSYTTPAYDRGDVVVHEGSGTVYTTPVGVETQTTTVQTAPRTIDNYRSRDIVYANPGSTTRDDPQFRSVAMRTPRNEITLDEFRTHVNAQSAVIVDARLPREFRKGHVRGAINIPAGDEDAYMAKFRRDVSHDQLVIIYCGGPDCPAGENVASHLASQGYNNLRIYTPGWQHLSTTDLD